MPLCGFVGSRVSVRGVEAALFTIQQSYNEQTSAIKEENRAALPKCESFLPLQMLLIFQNV